MEDNTITNIIISEIAKNMGVPVNNVDLQKHALQLGLDSVQVVKILVSIGKKLGKDPIELKPWEHDSLAMWIKNLEGANH
ncbi:MAG: acyl carrier protein [Rhizobiales bacterium]|nr:acyl carrier protein [Hyphomicrobiales bacterium]